jgi:hypothetical protein
MDLAKQTVRHKIFGKGEILEENKNLITVQVGSGIKKFIFPDAFRGHLILTDAQSEEYVSGILDEMDSKTRLTREKEARRTKIRELHKSLPAHLKAQAAFGFIENDRNAFTDSWRLSPGAYRSGSNRGKPRALSRILPNSACLLTCAEESGEAGRCIWGTFMVREDFIGSESTDGIIHAHDKYRILLSEEESKNFLLGRYPDFYEAAGQKSWGPAEVKYFSNITMARILFDILQIKLGSDQQTLCEEFLNYFCRLNGIGKKTALQ